MLKKRPPRCSFTKSDGSPCSNYRLTADGLQKMIDAGFDLVADAAQFCSYHARTEAERYEFQSRGGSYSKKAHDERQAQKLQEALDAREVMPREIVVAAQALIRSLISSRLAGTTEPDIRRVAVGVYLASALWGAPEDRERLLRDLLPRDIRGRGDIGAIAEDELHVYIGELGAGEQHLVWETLNAAPSRHR